jgi:hypothetical protein
MSGAEPPRVDGVAGHPDIAGHPDEEELAAVVAALLSRGPDGRDGAGWRHVRLAALGLLPRWRAAQ